MDQKHIDREMSRYLNTITHDKGCLHVVLFTADGMVKSTSDNITRDVAERTAANLSGIQSLSQSLTEFCDAEALAWQRTIIDLGTHTVLLFAAGHMTYVAVSVEAEMTGSEVAVISSATVKAVNSMRHLLGTTERSDT